MKQYFVSFGITLGSGISLHYVARLLVSKVLLTQEKGTPMPDSSVR